MRENRAGMLCIAAVLSGQLACTSEASAPDKVRDKPASGSVPAAAATEAQTTQHHGLPWFNDASESALKAAKASGKSVLVDLWAPWCHTCLSMREYVLTADNLKGVSDELVFLAINTEREANAAFLQRVPLTVWPTLYLLDGEGKVLARWAGAASPAQLKSFIEDGLRTARADKVAADDPLALLVEGDRLLTNGQLDASVSKYRQALREAPADWARRADVLVALAGILRKQKQASACVELGLTSLEQAGRSASAGDFSYQVLECAKDLPKDDGGKANTLRRLVDRYLHALAADPKAPLTPDDRGDALGILREVRTQLGDHAGARAAAEQRLLVLARAAQGMPDEVALTYDMARADTLVFLQRGEEAVALLRARAAALPDDYTAHHHLARTYRDLARWDEGLQEVEVALQQSYGPRRIAILGVKVDLLLGAGAREEAKRVLEEQVASYGALPLGQRQPGREEAATRRLAEWRN